MKKIIFVLSCLLVTIGLCACGGGGGLFGLAPTPEPTPVPEIDPVSILSPDEVYEALNYEYVPVIDGGLIYHDDGYKHYMTYVSDPKGQGDSVRIEVAQYTDTVTPETIWYSFDEAMQKRSDRESVEGIGEVAYIAFPSIHVYDRGCGITISAGSGDSEEQRQLLVNLAQRAVTNLEAQISPLPVPEGN
ncbi:MAG: hypothetical protein PUF72_04290 [Clostridiales bacterium]|nr:hypothetical protein [Clostridiales bacterium]